MIEFVDSNLMVGKRKVLREGSVYKTEDYLELMDRCGVKSAMAYHSIAKECDIIPGNQMLDEFLKTNKRFMGQWVIMPSDTEESYAPEELIHKMKQSGIKAVRIYPQMHMFSIKSYTCGKLFKTLQAHKIPVFIEKCEIEWGDLYELLKEYPKLPVVLCDTGYRCRRQLLPILRECKNLYVESSSYVPNNGVEDFCKKVGADRMIFGSGIPNGSVCGATALIRYSCISEEEKQKIASGNLLRLLAEVKL